MLNKILLCSFLFLSIFLNGCAKESIYPRAKSNLTVGMVKSKIIIGETSQSEIMTLFGAPNLITANSKNNEVWNYNKMSFEQSRNNVIAYSTTSSFDLIIIFGDNDIVQDYNLISASY